MNRLKQLRIGAQMSQQELAKRMGVAQNTVSNWENGKRRIDQQALLDLAQMFGVSVEYLLGATDQQQKEAQLLAVFRTLTPEQQDRLLNFFNDAL